MIHNHKKFRYFTTLNQTGCKLHFVITQACRDMVKEWDRRDASRRKALSQLQTKSPMPNASRLVTIANSIDLNLKKSENVTSCFASSEQKAYLEKVKEERLVKEELMSQDEEEEIPVTEREMNLKVIFVDYDHDNVTSYSARE